MTSIWTGKKELYADLSLKGKWGVYKYYSGGADILQMQIITLEVLFKIN